jgi:SAM-dependent methyltransferase
MMGNPTSSPAETYETYMVPAFFSPLATHVLAVAQPQPGERVLDAACGTGIVARRVAALFGTQGQVVGLDLNPAMLTVARAVATREGLTVDWREGRVESLPFPDANFDLVVCQHGLQYVPDRAAAITELRRVLRPGGRVVVSVQQPIETRPFDLRLDAVLQAQLGVAAVRQIYALSNTEELRTLLAGAGLHDITITLVAFPTRYPDPVQYLRLRLTSVIAAIPSLQQLDDQGREELVAAIGQEMAQPLREYTVGDEIVMPSGVQIAHASR